jgi:hypothetical protein
MNGRQPVPSAATADADLVNLGGTSSGGIPTIYNMIDPSNRSTASAHDDWFKF